MTDVNPNILVFSCVKYSSWYMVRFSAYLAVGWVYLSVVQVIKYPYNAYMCKGWVWGGGG